MDFWQKVAKDVRKGLSEGIDAVKEGATAVRDKTVELTEEGQRKIKAHGVEFRSHLDGSLLFLGPKESMEIQRTLGSDIAMVFDDCPPHTSTPRELRAAVERTIRWAGECREQPRGPG